MQNSKDVKVVLLGASGVGKSSILLRFVTNDFKEHYETTLGAAFLAKTLVYNDQPIKFQIWDTAGQEKYHSLAPLYYKDSQVAIVVYDITNKQSFDVLKTWIEEIKMYGPKNILIAIVGNKIDLPDEEISFQEAKKFATDHKAILSLTSAKENKGIEPLFQKLAEEIEKKELEFSSQFFTKNQNQQQNRGAKLNQINTNQNNNNSNNNSGGGCSC